MDLLNGESYRGGTKIILVWQRWHLRHLGCEYVYNGLGKIHGFSGGRTRRIKLGRVYFVPTGGVHADATNLVGMSHMFATWTSSKFTSCSRHGTAKTCVKTK